MFFMVSKETRYEDGKFIRVWELAQIRSRKDAMMVRVGDTIIFDTMKFKVTWIGNDDRYYPNEIVWCGRITGDNPYGLEENSIIAWGPRGMAETFPQYQENKFIGIAPKLTEKK